MDPDSCVIIFDESVDFLDILQIALKSMFEPAQCLRYDGREALERRGAILENFQANNGKVLLMSRTAGGIGLNIAWVDSGGELWIMLKGCGKKLLGLFKSLVLGDDSVIR